MHILKEWWIMKIIFNADDFGYSKGVNLGIVEAYQNGVVRSTTIMAGMVGFDHATVLSKENRGLKVGAHLTLTAGKSVGGVYRTITDEKGNFLKLNVLEARAKDKEIDLDEVEREYEAQIQKIMSAGIEADHFDSHHHTHNLEGIVEVFLKLAKKYGKKVRIYEKGRLNGEYAGIITTDQFVDGFYDENATVDYLKQAISKKNQETLEIMCHPAYMDYALYKGSSYNVKRVCELDVLTSDALKDYLDGNSVQIASFSDL